MVVALRRYSSPKVSIVICQGKELFNVALRTYISGVYVVCSAIMDEGLAKRFYSQGLYPSWLSI